LGTYRTHNPMLKTFFAISTSWRGRHDVSVCGTSLVSEWRDRNKACGTRDWTANLQKANFWPKITSRLKHECSTHRPSSIFHDTNTAKHDTKQPRIFVQWVFKTAVCIAAHHLASVTPSKGFPTPIHVAMVKN